MRRVVVTGIGMCTPLGFGWEHCWNKLIEGKSGIRQLSGFEISDLPSKVGGQLLMEGDETLFSENIIEVKDRKKIEPFIEYALIAANEALKDSGWKSESDEDSYKTGVMIGSGIGGLDGIRKSSESLLRSPRKISPFFIPSCLINLASGHVSIRYGFKGPNHSVVTACASGAHAIGDSSRLIMFGDADVMIAGGAEASISEIGIAGFNACKALSTKYESEPSAASRPYDINRDGFVMGEGSGIVVLEEFEHAVERGAKIYAEILGYGLSGDAHHITAPSEDGEGGERAMKAALSKAKVDAKQINYINAHGTSTMADTIELAAVERLMGSAAANVKMSSTKSMTGHLLGAAGAIEAIFSILAIRDQIVPPTINLDEPAVRTEVDLVANQKQECEVNYALSNSFGFGGTNASLLLGKLK